jgi:group I intron endonuclease
MKESSIYIITNNVNGKIYIGSAKVYSYRINSHKSRLKNGTHTNKHLQNAWIKYGEYNFSFKQLEIVDKIENLIEREQYYLDKYLFASDNSDVFYELGYNKVRIAGINLGYKFSAEGKKNISEAHKGILASEETKKKMSYVQSGENNHFYGKTHSKKAKEKISKALKGIKRDITFKNKISKAFSKAVLQYSLEKKEFIKRWDSAKQAEEVLNITHISAVCRKERKSAGKYYWEYEQKK